MRIIMDGETRILQEEKGIAAILEEVFSELSTNNRVIVTCQVNEQLIEDHDQLATVIQELLAQGQPLPTVILKTQSQSEAVAELVGSVSAFIDQVLTFLNGGVRTIQSGKEMNVSQWNQLFDSLDWLSQAVVLIGKQSGGETANRLIAGVNDLNAVLLKMVDALEHNDTLLVSDLLEYELADRLESLQNLLGQR